MDYKEMTKEEKNAMYKYTLTKGVALFFGMVILSIVSFYEHNNTVRYLVLRIAVSFVIALLAMIPISAYYCNSGDFDKNHK